MDGINDKHVDFIKNSNADLLRRVVACTPGSLYWKDRQGHYLGCNDFMLKITAMSSVEEIKGKTDYDLWGGDSAKQIIANDQKVMRTGQTLNFDEDVTMPSGETLYFTGMKMPLRDNNNSIIGVIGSSLDVTELKLTQEKLRIAKEQAESSNRAKSIFLANMSHDLKTPLSGILSTAENLAYKLKEQENIRNAEYIMQSSICLMDLLSEVIEIAKLEYYDATKDQQLFNPIEIANSVFELMRLSFEAKKVKLIVDFDRSLPTYLIGNKILFHRVLLNLISNAIKFTNAGHVTINMKLVEQKQNKAIIKVVIEDTGVGIAKDKQREIFESFTRVVPSYKGSYKGTGLGLYIVKQYISQLGGEISVYSKLGEGSTFTCVIPFPIALGQERFMKEHQKEESSYGNLFSYDTTVAEPIDETVYKKRPVYILVIEDEPGVQRAIKEKLQSLGYFIDVAQTGQDAIAFFEPHKYDLIYLDIGLPDMDGYNVAKHIRKIEKSIEEKTPIIALTAHLDMRTEKACFDSFIDGFLTKPLMREQAQQVVEKFVLGSAKHSMVDIEKSKKETLHSNKVIDLELGAKLIDHDVNAAKEILTMLIKQVPEHQMAMETAYRERDFESLKHIVHKFHSALCYSAAPRLKVAIANLETHLKLNHKNKIDLSYQNVDRELRVLLKAYEQL